jgi:pyruvate kinase
MKSEKIQKLLGQVEALLDELARHREKYPHILDGRHEAHQKSILNLLDYLTLRSHDLRELQGKLGYLGMSRLARAEAHTEASLHAARYYLTCLLDSPSEWPEKQRLSIKSGERILEKNTRALFGEPRTDRCQRIMVTMPGFTAENDQLVEDMIISGMDVARINCAHDDPDTWERIIRHIRNKDQKLGRKTTIAMDICGPKIRTGELDKPLVLQAGDFLKLYKHPVKGQRASYDEVGRMVEPDSVSCTLPEAFDYLREGHRVYFDDGEIKSEVIDLKPDHALLQIIRPSEKGRKLRADKGINFPDSNLDIHGLTQTDRENLRFITRHADIVNFSFVNTREDVMEMHEALKEQDALDAIGIVYKIETKKAYHHLVSILVEAMRTERVGVMIARGDLAIETGWNHLGYIQKEMLAICNACHIPIIWATQVLEKLAKKGLPSRAEITDVVNATKAECIMLNKGPHIVKAIELLHDIITHMEPYQVKNAPMLPQMIR